ncbi:MAG: FG-GAP repeat domain-containing protein [Planctomycetota bacterium]
MSIRNYIYRSRHIVITLFAALLLLGGCSASLETSQQPRFVAHRVGHFRSEACCVGDFNNDGKMDILAGPYWYEAPYWKAHQFRDPKGKVDAQGKTHTVDEKGIGYWDDFMNVPLDVDGDGLLDVVTCGWFSKQAEWYRNTGVAGGHWPMTVAEKNGNYECGELWDIDGDGKKFEILPDTKDTKWYEIGIKNDGKRGLIRQQVSQNSKPFGGGVGDINGDGRPDILRPGAWYEAPVDPRNGQWKEHPLALGSMDEGQADHTPQIQVYDIDDDGLNDILTSSAHKHGIFWYKQIRTGSKITWQRHIIDKSWSQAHSITLADLDEDGDLDFVTGKRFFAHNGNDPDARSPLCVYWYELKRGAAVEWVKHTISYGEGISSSLNIPVVDMDGDGDLDIVVTGKWGGPVYFENKSKSNR